MLNEQNLPPVYINFNTQRTPPQNGYLNSPNSFWNLSIERESHEHLLTNQPSNIYVNPIPLLTNPSFPLPAINEIDHNEANNGNNENNENNHPNVILNSNPDANHNDENNNQAPQNIVDNNNHEQDSLRLLEEQKVYQSWLIEFQINSFFAHAFAVLFILYYLVNIKYIFMIYILFSRESNPLI